MAISNKQLQDQVKGIKSEVHTMRTELALFRDSTTTKLSALHDFMIITQDRTVRSPGGNLNWQKIAEKILAFLTPIALALLAAIQLLGKQ